MHAFPIRRAAFGAVACLALFGVASCSSPMPAAPAAPAAPGAPAAPAGGAMSGAMGAAGPLGAGAAALAALGGLGQNQGGTDQIRQLGGDLATNGQNLLGQLASQGAAAVTPSAEQQGVLTALAAQTGAPFDQAWLQAAGQFGQQARDAANAVLSSSDATPEQRSAAEAALAQLDSLDAGVASAAAGGTAGAPSSAAAAAPTSSAAPSAAPGTAAGGSGAGGTGAGGSGAGAGGSGGSGPADTPTSVDAGDGGQAAGPVAPLTGVVLLGIGALLVGGALWRRRVS